MGGAALIGARLRSRALGEVPHSPPIPAEIAWTNSVSAIVAKRSIRPRSLRVPHRSRFRREVLRTGDYRAVSGFVVGFVRPGHRHRVAQGDQRYQHEDGEFHGWDHSTDEARHFHKNVLPGRRCLRRTGPALEQAGWQKVEGWCVERRRSSIPPDPLSLLHLVAPCTTAGTYLSANCSPCVSGVPDASGRPLANITICRGVFRARLIWIAALLFRRRFQELMGRAQYGCI